MSNPPYIRGFAVQPGGHCDSRMDGDISALLQNGLTIASRFLRRQAALHKAFFNCQRRRVRTKMRRGGDDICSAVMTP
jgi:hypothetical protein